MSDQPETKVCAMCAETIKAAAKLCPFCQSRQSRFAFWWYECFAILAALSMVAVAIAAIVWLAPEEKGVGGRNFASHRNDLAVFGTTLGRVQARPDFWLTGFVTNRGEHPWRVHELEVRFLDERDELLDVRRAVPSQAFVVPPRQDHGFRVDLGELVFTNSNVTRQLRVQLATDGDRRFDPD